MIFFIIFFNDVFFFALIDRTERPFALETVLYNVLKNKQSWSHAYPHYE